MKLKEAKKIAKHLGLKWISVDAGGEIYGYKFKPILNEIGDCWDIRVSGFSSFIDFETKYTGSKHWTKTRRKVK